MVSPRPDPPFDGGNQQHDGEAHPQVNLKSPPAGPKARRSRNTFTRPNSTPTEARVNVLPPNSVEYRP